VLLKCGGKRKDSKMICSSKYKKNCKHIDTAGMTKTKGCHECDWYNNGVKETGAMPILQWFLELFKRGKPNCT